MKTLCLSLGLLLFTVVTACAEDSAKSVALADTPAAVQKAISAHVADGRVDAIDQVPQNGEIVFEVDFTSSTGGDHDFTVAEDGTLLSLGLELADLPANLKRAIQSEANGAEITGINFFQQVLICSRYNPDIYVYLFFAPYARDFIFLQCT